VTKYICVTCGAQYGDTEKELATCKICAEERQYVNPKGQTWTTLEKMVQSGEYKNTIAEEESQLYSIKTTPKVGIGQTAYLVQDKDSGFNLLWDCITYLDGPTINEIRTLGGIDAIALSHPHYYSTQVEWAETFDAPIYIHEDDQVWVTRPSERIIFWTGESLELQSGLVLHRLGGHFKGGAVLEWSRGHSGKGILLTGDIIQVVADPKWVSFMYSYPNLIPLPAAKVQEIADRVQDLKFDRLYNAFHGIVSEDAQSAVQKSAERYIAALNGTLFNT
jgi:glyoxylase-like metal-dependent hydrolase (beta-lactamase superfamily II)